MFTKNTYGLQHFYFEPKERQKEVYLTIDDCPGHTSDTFAEMLDILKKHKVNATLFITSNYAQEKPEMVFLLKQASLEGHDLANHMPEDIPYHKVSKQVFENALVQTKEFLE